MTEWHVLSALAYALGAVVTASWTVGCQGTGRDGYDRLALPRDLHNGGVE